MCNFSHELNSHDLCCFERFLLEYFWPGINKFFRKFLPFLQLLIKKLDLFLNQNNLLLINLNNISTEKILSLFVKFINLINKGKNIHIQFLIRLFRHKFPILIIEGFILIFKFLMLLSKFCISWTHFLDLCHVEIKFVLV